MNQYERKSIIDLRQKTKADLNRYRFAWYLIQRHPNLVVAIIQDYLAKIEREIKNAS